MKKVENLGTERLSVKKGRFQHIYLFIPIQCIFIMKNFILFRNIFQ